MISRTLLLFLSIALAAMCTRGFPAKVSGQTVQPTAGSDDRHPSDDLRLSDGTFVAEFGTNKRPYLDRYGFQTSNAYGSILDFRSLGTAPDSNVMTGSPVLFYESQRRYIVYSSVEATDDGTTIHSVASGELGDPRKRYEVSTTYSLLPGTGVIDVRSRLVNTGIDTFADIRFSLHHDANRFYVFSPYGLNRHPELRFEVVPRPDNSLGWVDLNAHDDTNDPLLVTLAPGDAQEVQYALTVDDNYGRLLETIYRLLGVDATPVVLRFEDLAPGMFEVVVREIANGSVFFRTFLDDPSPLTLMLPPGTYKVTGNLFPAVVESIVTVGRETTECTLENPSRGRVSLAVRDEAGDPVPGKVTFIGLHPTPSPYFPPHDPVKSGLPWERVKNSAFPVYSDLELELPVGSYLVSASHGPEYTLDQTVVDVLAGGLTELRFQIERVVDTQGLVSVDPHMHTLKSDGAVTAAERVISVVAEGVDVAVATDHFFRHDFVPAAEAAGLTDRLGVIAGSEISFRDPLDYSYTLDFSIYPLAPGESGWSAVETLSNDVAAIFEETRQRYPDALIQINHPRRLSEGYLTTYDLDPDSATTVREGFWAGFDLLEVLNGPSLRSSYNSRTVNDWLNLLARGFYYPAVAGSDAHRIDTEEPGYSRTYVYVTDQDMHNPDNTAVIESLRRGRSFVTNGPIVEVTVNDRHLPGDTLSAVEGKVELHIDVRATPWISVDKVTVMVNRHIVQTLPIDAAPGSTQRLQRDLNLELVGDGFIVIEVTGKSSLYPVVQERSRSGQLIDAVTPYALTNPVFVDVDGNGRFDAPLQRVIRPLPPGSR